jgi:hypothetical protein
MATSMLLALAIGMQDLPPDCKQVQVESPPRATAPVPGPESSLIYRHGDAARPVGFVENIAQIKILLYWHNKAAPA